MVETGNSILWPSTEQEGIPMWGRWLIIAQQVCYIFPVSEATLNYKKDIWVETAYMEATAIKVGDV